MDRTNPTFPRTPRQARFPLLVGLAILTLACTCIGTQPIANQAPTAVQVQPPPSGPRVLFEDDFSSRTNPWDIEDQEYKITDFTDGQYRIWVNNDQLDVWGVAHQYFEGDVSIQVEASKVAGPDINDYGLICRYTEDENNDAENQYWFYFFIIGSNGAATIAKVDGTRQTYLSQSGSMEYHSAIRTGNATNTIRADCIGSTLTLYVNGQQVMRVRDDSFQAGDVGLIAGTFDEIGVDIRFDNFIVTRP